MEWEFVIALIIAIPVILFPAAFVWYLNIHGVLRAVREARRKKQEATATREEKAKGMAA